MGSQEYNPALVSLLLMVALSLPLPQRRPLVDLSGFRLPPDPCVTVPCDDELANLISDSVLVIPGSSELWLDALRYARERRWKRSLVLLFPLLEHALRQVVSLPCQSLMHMQ